MHLASAKGPDAVRAFHLVHVQDEADIRLRSSEAREGALGAQTRPSVQGGRAAARDPDGARFARGQDCTDVGNALGSDSAPSRPWRLAWKGDTMPVH